MPITHSFVNKGLTSNQSDDTIDERYNLKWKEKNSEWYPDYVKYNCSEGLETCISNVTKDKLSPKRQRTKILEQSNSKPM